MAFVYWWQHFMKSPSFHFGGDPFGTLDRREDADVMPRRESPGEAPRCSKWIGQESPAAT